jgi:hypothetical protein
MLNCAPPFHTIADPSDIWPSNNARCPMIGARRRQFRNHKRNHHGFVHTNGFRLEDKRRVVGVYAYIAPAGRLFSRESPL